MNETEFHLNRAHMSEPCAEPYGTSRFVKRTDKKQSIQLFFDHSVLELFINNGKNTMTSRVFIKNPDILKINGNIEGRMHYLK